MHFLKRLEIFMLEHWKTLLKLAFALALTALIFLEGRNQLESIHLASTLELLRSVPLAWIAAFFVLGVVASFSMVLYDVFGMKAFGFEIDRTDLLAISFVSNSLNALLGLGGLTGASIKTLLLKKHSADFKEMIPYNAFMVASATTGLSLFAVIAIANNRGISALLGLHRWLWACLAAYSLYIAAYFVLERFVRTSREWAESFGLRKLFALKLKLTAVSVLEWLLAGVLLFAIADHFHHGISFLDVISVFAAAAIAGILSFLPGGAGSFDLIAIMGLEAAGLSPNEALSAVILYRVFYYLAPSLTAIATFSVQVLRKSERKVTEIRSGVYGQFVSALMAITVLICGSVLLISAFTPSLLSRSRLLTTIASAGFLQYSRSISISIGLILLIMSRDIFWRVKRSYHAAMLLLLAGGIFTFVKGFDFEELAFLLFCMGIIRLSRVNFYRKSIPVKKSSLIAVAASVLVLLAAYLRGSHLLFTSYIKEFKYPLDAFRHLGAFIHSGIVAYALFIAFLLLWYFTRSRIEKDPLYQGTDQVRLEGFLKTHAGHHLSHMMHLGDKQLFWACEGQVLLAYAKYSDRIVVLGDPVGEESLIRSGIQEFQSFLDLYGYRAVFYQVSDENLSMYHENGCYFFKLGEEAVVDLTEFDMAGSGRRSFRNTVRRFEKEGYSFELLQPPFSAELLDELEQVSREWIGKRKEMSFSVGWFDRRYLQEAPVAVLRSPSGKLLAFISLTDMGPGKQCAGIDLMRFGKDAPSSTMEFMFIQLLLNYKEMGFKGFSLGVASLSQVGYSPKSHLAEKLAGLISKHGKLFYSFEGLRRFKDKFDPDWKPVYLAYPQLMSLPALLIELSMLVNKPSIPQNSQTPENVL
jgi:phosphatidylglycerol lysyltransferase